jgi:L-ascorbate 6-phosphate lactonase
MDETALVPLPPRPGQVAVRWLGQGGFAFRNPEGGVWCVDPYLSNYGGRGPVDRLAPAPVAGIDVRADAVLCSHAHGDHTDPITLPEIAQAAPDCRFFAAAEGIAKMESFGIPVSRLHTVKAGDRGIAIAPGVTAEIVFASHSGDAVGFVFHTAGLRLYVTGDTLYDPQLISDATCGVDLLCVCINGRMGNMSHEEAARLSGELGARIVIPMHYGVMPHNTIEPSLFLDSLRAQGSASTPHVLEIGETVLLS